ncbi:MAG: hypothetical protein M1823_003624 [Watsoniomyces obsoletus]|nr:MAG: hypothetical protein M1823_003624 [Watsoniomyces obsoletus]
MPDQVPDSPKPEAQDDILIISPPRKKPPPETPEHTRRRLLIILSFWAIIVFLGLPIWRWTTSIYRAKLPLQQMMDWAEGRACKLEFPLQIYIQAPNLQESEAQHLVRLTQHALDDLNDFSAHHLRLQLAEAANGTTNSDQAGYVSSDGLEDAGLVVKLIPGESGTTPQAILEAHSPTLNVVYSPNQAPSISSTASPLASFLAVQLQDIFAEEQAMIAYVLSKQSTNNPSSSTSGSTSSSNSPTASSSNGRSSNRPASSETTTADVSRRITRAAKYAPTYHLTFSLFTPHAEPSSWAIDSAIRNHLQPLLQTLSAISNFTIDTQVQLYAKFSPSVREPEFENATQSWTLRRDDLAGFINAAEWPLSPSIGGAPTLNFVLYVPGPEHSPLTIAGTAEGGSNNGHGNGNSWLVPQWGSVFILNPPPPQSQEQEQQPEQPLPTQHHLTEELLHEPLQVFSTHLLALLGAPRSPTSLPLRLLTLTRLRCATLLLSASSTLGALARLTHALPSISIPPSVATHVEQAMDHLPATCHLLVQDNDHNQNQNKPVLSPTTASSKTSSSSSIGTKTGSGNLLKMMKKNHPKDALRHARLAEHHAELAFFDKSMVGQVYFPDEHKVAVYLPLLGPVGVPLVVALVKEVKRIWIRYRGRES